MHFIRVIGRRVRLRASNAIRPRIEWLEARELLAANSAVILFSPPNQSMGLPLGTNIVATFGSPVNESTVNAIDFFLRDENGQTVPATVSYSSATNSVQLTPSVALEQSETFTATIKGGAMGIKGTDGSTLTSNLSWSFTTENFVNAATAIPGVKIDRTSGLLTNAAGGQALFSVVLTSAPLDDVTIPLRASNPAGGSVSMPSLVFTPMNWNMPQAVAVNGAVSPAAASDLAYSVIVGATSSSDNSYNRIDPPDVSLVNQAVNTRPLLEAAAASEAARFVYSTNYAVTMPMGMMEAAMSAGMMTEQNAVLALVSISAVTNVVVKSGNWSDSTTWANQQIPSAGSNIWVMPGRTLTVDGNIAPSLRTIRISGTLNFATNTNTKLNVDTIVVDPTGTFTMGTAASPISSGVSANVTFTDTGATDRAWDPYGYSRGLISLGSATIVGAAKTSTAQLATTPQVGVMTIVLGTAPSKWAVGDLIDIPGTTGGQDEQFLIAGISADGKTITLNDPIALVRTAPTQPGQALYVANLTRNIKFNSQTTQDITRRGHVTFMHTSDETVQYAAFNGLGRTDFSQAIDNAVVDKNGLLVPGTGTNPKGRYSLHFHMTGTDDPMDPILVLGCVVNDAAGWGFDNHSGNVDFESNVAYNTREAGFATETGNEIGTFNNNFAIRGGHVGFWLNGPYVTFTNNVASGFTSNYGEGVLLWGYTNVTASGVPIYMDASKVMTQGNTPPVDPLLPAGQLRIELLPFHLVGTQVYNSWGGIEIRAHQGDLGPDYRSTVDGGAVWGVQRGLTFNYSTAVTINDLAIYGNGQWDSSGIFSDLGPRDTVFNNLTDVDWGYGITFSGSGSVAINGGFFNNTVNFLIPTFDFGSTPDLTSRFINISGVTIGTALTPSLLIPSPNSTCYNVYLDAIPLDPSTPMKRFLADKIVFNGKQVYFLDQASNFVVTGTGIANYDGKTNAQLMSAYGIATRGTVTPPRTQTDPLIYGGTVQTNVATPTSQPNAQAASSAGPPASQAIHSESAAQGPVIPSAAETSAPTFSALGGAANNPSGQPVAVGSEAANSERTRHFLARFHPRRTSHHVNHRVHAFQIINWRFR